MGLWWKYGQQTVNFRGCNHTTTHEKTPSRARSEAIISSYSLKYACAGFEGFQGERIAPGLRPFLMYDECHTKKGSVGELYQKYSLSCREKRATLITMEGSNNKVIFRVTRLANPGKTGRALAHNLREHSPEWADPEREKLNVYHGARTRGELKEAIKKRVDTVARKLRPDAVKAVEIFASYSKNALTDQNGHGYLKTVEDWLEKKYGKENVLSVAYHKDEEVPHLHAILTPIYKNDKGENALSAKKLFSGKKWMSNLQTEIWEKCGLPYGLDRGEIGSQATHRPLSEYRKDINARTPKFRVEIPPATLSRAKREEWAEEQNLKLKAATGKGFAQYQRERTQIFKENHSMSDKVKDYDRLKIELESEKERSKKLQEALNAKQKSYDYLGETLAYGSAKHIEIMKGNAQQYFKDNGQTLPRQLDEKNIDPKYQRGMDSDLGISL